MQILGKFTLSPRYHGYLLGLGLGLCAYLIFQTVMSAYQFWQARISINLAATPPMQTSPSKTGLQEMHLFGQTADLEQLPPSSLPLTLQGIAFSENPGIASMAILGGQGSDIGAYQAGQQLLPGIIIKAITPTAVILSEHHTLTRLTLSTPEVIRPTTPTKKQAAR